MAAQFAGFEIRDQIMWIYGSGFPKSQDVGRQIHKKANGKPDKQRFDPAIMIKEDGKYRHPETNKLYNILPDINGDNLKVSHEGTKYSVIFEEVIEVDSDWSGWGTQLKPAHEPIVMARKPVIGSIRENVLEHGTGAINIDATRVGDDIMPIGAHEQTKNLFDPNKKSAYSEKTNIGRFPANVIHDGSDEVVSLFPHSTSGARKSTHKIKGLDTGEQRAVFGDDAISGKYNVQPFTDAQADEGSAARFFYCPKVSRKERHIGFDPNSQGVIIDSEVFGKTPVCLDCGKTRNGSTKHDGCDPENIGFQERRTERSSDVGNNHPTVKPIELMKYLIKLVTPPNGHILDPFNGSGSTGCAAVELGFDYTGIELDPNYVEIATKRISHWEQECKPKTTYNNLFEEII
jgi:site-specific DNA-methyltransferase (adenine-specific)